MGIESSRSKQEIRFLKAYEFSIDVLNALLQVNEIHLWDYMRL